MRASATRPPRASGSRSASRARRRRRDDEIGGMRTASLPMPRASPCSRPRRGARRRHSFPRSTARSHMPANAHLRDACDRDAATGREFRAAELQGFTPHFSDIRGAYRVAAATPSLDRVVFEHNTGRHDGTSRWRRWIHLDSTQFSPTSSRSQRRCPADARGRATEPGSPGAFARSADRAASERVASERARTTIDRAAVTRLTAVLPGDTTPIWVELSPRAGA